MQGPLLLGTVGRYFSWNKASEQWALFTRKATANRKNKPEFGRTCRVALRTFYSPLKGASWREALSAPSSSAKVRFWTFLQHQRQGGAKNLFQEVLGRETVWELLLLLARCRSCKWTVLAPKLVVATSRGSPKINVDKCQKMPKTPFYWHKPSHANNTNFRCKTVVLQYLAHLVI